MSPPLTAQEAARLYSTTVRYIYKLASLHNWRRIRIDGRAHYNSEDVDAVLGK